MRSAARSTLLLLGFVSWVSVNPLRADFVRGDVDGSGELLLTDAVQVFGYLFLGSPEKLPCLDAADANDAGELNLTSGIHILQFLFLGGPPPSQPFPECGQDPTPDGLSCEEYAHCEGGPEDPPADDYDQDGIFNEEDNCRWRSNSGQEDGDRDGVGNVCDNCPSTPNPDQALRACWTLPLDDYLFVVAEIVPQFGGMYYGPEGDLRIVLTDPGDEVLEAARSAIQEIFGSNLVNVENAQAIRGDFSFLELLPARRESRALLSFPGVTLVDADEVANRVVIGLEQIDALPETEEMLAEMGIPLEMVEFVEEQKVQPHYTENPEFEAYLRSRVRPLLGGLEIRSNAGTCSLGFVARLGNTVGFVTNTHCTGAPGMNSAVFGQPDSMALADVVGTESVDPPLLGGQVPLISHWRYSDAAFVTLEQGVTARFGLIARPGGSAYGIGSTKPSPLCGETMYKVGQRSGESEGKVIRTCVDVGVDTSDHPAYPDAVVMLDQAQAEYYSNGGDSGSPVFQKTDWQWGIMHTLCGIHWGGTDDHSSFSPMWNIEHDLGSLGVGYGNSSPTIEITQPTEGSSIGSGSFIHLTLSADFWDLEDGTGTPECRVEWVSDVDGFLGESPVVNGVATLEVMVSGGGQRTFTATAYDYLGTEGTDSVTVTTGNSAPEVTIERPGARRTLYTGIPYVFESTSWDAELFTALPCDALTWTSNNRGGPFPQTGCNPTVTFSTPGVRTITLTGVDPQGASGTDTVTVHVVNPQPGTPPIVTILQPTNSATVQPHAMTMLWGTATDPDGQSPISYRWVLEWNNTEIELGTDSTSNGWMTMQEWTPSDQVPSNCGGQSVNIILYATDADGDQGSASVELIVAYPPC